MTDAERLAEVRRILLGEIYPHDNPRRAREWLVRGGKEGYGWFSVSKLAGRRIYRLTTPHPRRRRGAKRK